jgi:predicted DNA-binding transcriptional regulator AlpA
MADKRHYKCPNLSYDAISGGGSSSDVLFDKLIWGIDEVCTFTRYARGTVYNLVSEGEIPVRRRGRKGRLVFVPNEVIAWFRGE